MSAAALPPKIQPYRTKRTLGPIGLRPWLSLHSLPPGAPLVGSPTVSQAALSNVLG
jgi:hypothetical protein